MWYAHIYVRLWRSKSLGHMGSRCVCMHVACRPADGVCTCMCSITPSRGAAQSWHRARAAPQACACICMHGCAASSLTTVTRYGTIPALSMRPAAGTHATCLRALRVGGEERPRHPRPPSDCAHAFADEPPTHCCAALFHPPRAAGRGLTDPQC